MTSGFFAALVGSVMIVMAMAAPVQAQEAVPSWQIITADSTLEFEGVQMGAPFQGHFKEFGGTIQFDAANLAASKATIAIHVGSADAGSADRDKNLKMKDWFNIDVFPDAHFVTTSFEKGLATNQYVAKGNLTIRDVTLPVVLPFTLEFAKSDSGQSLATMVGETAINRLDFGVGQGQWSDTKSVGNQVKLRIKLKATQVGVGPL
jgi:polyisoprenoid-binding protein YceI